MSEIPRRLPCDPVCGRELSEEQALLSTEVSGDRYLFCSERCRLLFSIRPGWFLERTEPRPARRAS
jgi:YHS domain-containing protein